MYDYGVVGNILHYNKTTPPEYKLQEMLKPPVAFFAGTQDDLADPSIGLLSYLTYWVQRMYKD